MGLKHNRILARHLTHRESHVTGHKTQSIWHRAGGSGLGARSSWHMAQGAGSGARGSGRGVGSTERKKKSADLMSFFLIFLLLLGAATAIYAIIKRDFNLTLVGLGIIFYSLLTVFIVVKTRRKGVKAAHKSLHHFDIHAKKVMVHVNKKNRHPKIAFSQIIHHLIMRISSGLIMGKYKIMLFFFLLFGLAACWYFWYVEEDMILLGISAVITLIALISIVRNMKKGGAGSSKGLGLHSRGSKEKKPEGKQEGKVTQESVKAGDEKEKESEMIIGSINGSEIEKLKKVVKEKMDSLEKGKTPLDVLYWLLGEKKQLKMQEISKIFSIDIKKVEEWARILEAHEIVEISYPAFGPPALKIKNIPANK